MAKKTENDSDLYDLRKKFSRRIGSNPGSTLADLLAYLERAEQQMYDAGQYEPIGDDPDCGPDGEDYLSDFTVDVDPDNYTFGYRLANLDEDRAEAEDLAERLGGDFVLVPLPKKS